MAAGIHMLPSEDICTVRWPDIQEQLFPGNKSYGNTRKNVFAKKHNVAMCLQHRSQLLHYQLASRLAGLSGKEYNLSLSLTGAHSEMHP